MLRAEQSASECPPLSGCSIPSEEVLDAEVKQKEPDASESYVAGLTPAVRGQLCQCRGLDGFLVSCLLRRVGQCKVELPICSFTVAVVWGGFF